MAIKAYKGLDPTKLDQDVYLPKYDKLKAELQAKHPDWNSRKINKHIYSMKDMGHPRWTPDGKADLNGAVGAEDYHIRSGGPGKPSVPNSESFTKARNARDNPRRQARVKGNENYKETGEEGAKLWDELVGDPNKTIEIDGKTYTRDQFILREQTDKKLAYEAKKIANRKGGMSHGHALPTTHPDAVESPFQAFSEDPSGNFASQDRLPKDIDARIDASGIPRGKKADAQRFVGTAERIGDPLPDKEIERILKDTNFDGTVKFQPKRPPRGYFKDGLELVGKIGKTKAAKLAKRAIPYASGAFALASFTGKVKAATRDPSAKNYAKLGLSTIDLGLEAVDMFTMGLSTPVTLAAQASLFAVEDYIDNGLGAVHRAATGRTRR